MMDSHHRAADAAPLAFLVAAACDVSDGRWYAGIPTTPVAALLSVPAAHKNPGEPASSPPSRASPGKLESGLPRRRTAADRGASHAEPGPSVRSGADRSGARCGCPGPSPLVGRRDRRLVRVRLRARLGHLPDLLPGLLRQRAEHVRPAGPDRQTDPRRLRW